MNILVFCISHWTDQKHSNIVKPHLLEWQKRIDFYLDNPIKFLSMGSYSNPEYNPTSIPIIQNGMKYNVKEDSHFWRYGLFAGFNYALLNKEKLNWDIVIYAHYSLLLGFDLMPYLYDFMKRPESICAPTMNSNWGSFLDTAFMIMKEEAIVKWITESSIYTPHTNKQQKILSEEEATILFEDDWYNPFTNISTLHKYLFPHKGTITKMEKKFMLSLTDFLELPMILGLNFCEPYELNLWLEKHKLEKQ